MRTTYTTVESSSTSWNSGWCVVNSNTTISDRITVSGTVNLILGTITINGGIITAQDCRNYGAGITKVQENNE